MPLYSFANEECIFDENLYIEFIKKYEAEHKNSKIDGDNRTLTIFRNNEKIIVKGGGCIHLGTTINYKRDEAITETEFLELVASLSIEFGDWLINTEALKMSIKQRKWQKHDGWYFIPVNAMTVFEASYEPDGKMYVDFYIN